MWNRLKLTLVPRVGAWLITAFGHAIRFRTEGADGVDEEYRGGRHVIIAFWHARQLMLPLAYRGRGVHTLISQHRDGELIHRILARFGGQSVRGSTTRGGAAALRRLIKLGRAGMDLAITPDGPKGPREVVQMGIIHLARATGLPIMPLTYSCSHRTSVASWDRFVLPLPLGRGLFVWGRPIRVASEATATMLEVKRLELEKALHRLTTYADAATAV